MFKSGGFGWRAAAPLTAVLSLGLASSPLNAADAAMPRMIEEVLVSAQKVKQSSQDVPISLTAVSGEFMKSVGAVKLQDLAPYIPNVRFSSDTDPALTQINIRGFGSNPLNAAFESSVGFVQDEVFYNRPSYFSEAMFDIARVEVLRGPIKLSRSRPKHYHPAPVLGQDSDAVLAEVLRLDEQEVARLRTAGVIV